MLGAIAGDVIGSVYEWHNTKSTDFPLFSRLSRYTDDTVLTVAVADALLHRQPRKNWFSDKFYARASYRNSLQKYARMFPDSGYGQMFEEWAKARSDKPYRSYANGAAMRVCPIGFAFDNMEDVLREAKRSAEITHNHRDGIRGAQAIAACVFLARTGASKQDMKRFIEKNFRYKLSRTLDEIRPNYVFDSSAKGSVPEAIIAFLESESFEDAIRKAVSIGGDSDTIASMAGGIAHAYYKEIPPDIWSSVEMKLDWKFRNVIKLFTERYNV
jgi:ADP-ribosylglycohydrolase